MHLAPIEEYTQNLYLGKSLEYSKQRGQSSFGEAPHPSCLGTYIPGVAHVAVPVEVCELKTFLVACLSEHWRRKCRQKNGSYMYHQPRQRKNQLGTGRRRSPPCAAEVHGAQRLHTSHQGTAMPAGYAHDGALR